MVSTPVNPVLNIRFAQGPPTPENRIENHANVSLAQTGKFRPLLNSSRLELAGLCCCKVFVSRDLAESTVSNAKARSENVMCLYQLS